MKKIVLCTMFAVASSAYASNTVAQTQLIATQPTQAPNASSSQTGECFSHSILSNQSNAWRCRGGPKLVNLYDPCFQVNGSSTTLVCGIDPSTNNNGFTLNVTSLPHATNQGITGYWYLQLADGTYCRALDFTDPTIPFLVNKRGKMIDKDNLQAVCGQNPSSTGPLQDVYKASSGILAGTVKQGKVWTATEVFFQPVPDGNPNNVTLVKSQTVQIAKVWQ